MRALLLVFAMVAPLPLHVFGAVPDASRREPVGAAEGLFLYRFEKGDLRYADILTLQDGSKHLGKVMEWATQVLLYQADGTVVAWDVPEVEEFELRRSERHKTRPKLADLTVAYIERLPRDPSLHGHVVTENGLSRLDIDVTGVAWHPPVGTDVTFRVHILNAGAASSAQVDCRVSIDGVALAASTIPPLEPGAAHVVAVPWQWQDGRHTIRVDIDPGGKRPEIVRWNNTFVQTTGALAVAVVVARDRYEAFKMIPNLVDSFCFEDWLQYHVRIMNALFLASVYPSSPDGILERVRCDRILVVDDPADQPARARWERELRRGGDPNGLTEYAALWVLGRLSDDEGLAYDALMVDWSLLQQLGRQLGLADLTTTDTTIDQCMVLDQHDRYVQRRHLFPRPQTLMYTAGGFPLSEVGAGYLNESVGKPRGCRGSYLYQLPKKVTIEVRSGAGRPQNGVQVDAFQLMSEGAAAGTICGYGRADPLYSGQTGEDGRFTLLNLEAPSHRSPDGYELRPNPFGKIALDGSNGLLLLRLRHHGVEEFHFLRLYDCLLAYRRGSRDEYVCRLQTRFGDAAALPPPPYTSIRMPKRGGERPAMHVGWRFPKDLDTDRVQEFRIYKRTSFGGEQTKPWTLATVVQEGEDGWSLQVDGTYFDEFRYDGQYSLDTFYAVSTVDKEGRESDLSPPGYLAYGKECVKFALDVDTAYITLRGGGPSQMLYWNGAVGTQPYGVRTRQFPGYVPYFAGIAITPDHQLLITDPYNHVLAFYDRGDLVRVLPARDDWPGRPSEAPGEFSKPLDVALDGDGRIYVADGGNHRVQILDSRGGFLALLDENFRFDRPEAVGYANGYLCVTDKGGRRCRVYEVHAGPARFVRELPPLAHADRALVSKTGKIYVSGRDPDTGEIGILVFTPDGDTATFEKAVLEGTMGRYHRPRGLYLFRGTQGDFAYFVNQFPFDVRRCKME